MHKHGIIIALAIFFWQITVVFLVCFLIYIVAKAVVINVSEHLDA